MVSEWSHQPGPNTRQKSHKHPEAPLEPRHYDHEYLNEHSQTPTNSHSAFSPASLSVKLESLTSPVVTLNPYTEPQNQHQNGPNHQHQLEPQRQIYPSETQNDVMQGHALGVQGHVTDVLHDPEPGAAAADFTQYAQSSFLLDQLGSSYYESPALVTDGENRAPDFHLDGMNGMEFIAPQHLGHDSRAFPPSQFPENTPALAPTDARPPQQRNVPHNMVFQSPILPSQNSKSYNQEHLIQKQRQQRSRRSTPMMSQQPSAHAEPNFTPLVSPAVTPRESQVNSNKHTYAPAQTDFEPLTSPALKAQSQAVASAGTSAANTSSTPSTDDRRRSSAAFGADDYSQGQAKRRTPHSTPNLQAATSKLKRSPSLRKVPQYEVVSETVHDSQPLHSAETTPMLPPQGKKAIIDGQPSFNFANSSPSASYGPGTLMGFTMNRLAEQQGHETPNIKTESPPGPPTGPNRNRASSVASSTNTSAHTSAHNSAPPLTSSSETSPVLEGMSGEHDSMHGRRDRVPGKKTSHKIAEQGRRIRMNQAVHELSRLIPEQFQDGVTVPSKATTIELAAAYIRNLLHEIDALKNRNGE